MGGISRKLSIMLLTAAALALSCGSAMADWTLTNLGQQGSILQSTASSINNNGDIVGKAQFTGSTYEHATLWHNGVAYDLGVFSGGTGSIASAITDSGLIVGSVNWSGIVGQGSHAAGFNFNYSTNQVSAPTDLFPVSNYYNNGAFNYATDSVAAAINNSGQIAGQAWSDFGYHHAILWNKGTALGQEPPGSVNSAILGINNNGQMVGWAVPADANGIGTKYAASLWDTDGAKNLDSYIGTNYFSYAGDINDSGQVLINASYLDDATKWFSGVYSNGNFQLLAGLDGWKSVSAIALNNLGQIVGVATDATGTKHAVFWDNSTIIDLNSLFEGTGWNLTASDINDKGQILLWGNKDGSPNQAFLLSTVPTPIPAALPLFASGLAALGVFRRRFSRV